MTEHVATMTPTRPRGRRWIDVGVKCSCGARALFQVSGCEQPEVCRGVTHIRGGHSTPGPVSKGAPLVCPAAVAVIRMLDGSLTRRQAEGIAARGPGGEFGLEEDGEGGE